MQIILTIAILFLGLIVGSFISAWVFRLHTGRSIIWGRSSCMTCEATLSWYELVPLASFLVLRGKCRSCTAPISRQDPLVEVILGALFALTYIIFGLTWHALLVALSAVLLTALSVYDIRHTIIPNVYVYPFIGLAVIAALISPDPLAHLITGAGLALFFALLWLVSKGKWMGFGDAKLALGIGLLLGPALGISAIMVGFWAGALISIVLLAISKWGKERFSMSSQVPFAPFLVFGFFFVLFTGISFLPWM